MYALQVGLSEELGLPQKNAVYRTDSNPSMSGSDHSAEEEVDGLSALAVENQMNFKERGAVHLIHVLSSEAGHAGASAKHCVDHLTNVLTVWLLSPHDKEKKQRSSTQSILPRHTLQRVIARMRALRGDLDLQTLADESGYSRSHFLRMFRASTGYTPHRYLLRLRLERAKELLRQRSASLIDIAALCGFSSHAHLSKVFRQIVGVPPSEYRRNLQT